MEDNKFVTDKELEEIDKVEIDNKLLAKLKTKQKNNFFQELIYKAIEKVKEQLEDEEIEIYFQGRNFNSNTARALLTIISPIVSHPMLGWFSNVVIIKTNKRILVMETNNYNEYVTHYEINKEIHIYSEDKFVYLTIKDMKGKSKIIQYSKEKAKFLLEYIGELCTVIEDKKIKIITNIIYKTVVTIEIIAIITFLIWCIYHYLILGKL